MLGSYKTGVYNASAAEIVAHDPASQRLFFVRGAAPILTAVSIANPAAPAFAFDINIATFWSGGSAFGGANSVAVRNSTLAVAVEASPKTDPGRVMFFSTNGVYLGQVTVGALPDMLTFNEDGTKILVANEGEPNSYGQPTSVDPEGSISIVDISGGIAGATVATVSFASYNGQLATLRAAGVRIFGPGATVAQDLEPEYITTKGDLAWVSLQENNALARIRISTASVLDIVPLGTKDHSLARNALDASDRDNGSNGPAIKFRTLPVKGLYLPDGIASYTVGGNTYIVTANEGDAREDWPGYNETKRVNNATLLLDPTVFPNAAALKADSILGRLNISIASGDLDGDGDFDELHAYGARSFTIRDANGALVWDSGDDFERITAAAYPAFFNASNSNNTFDSRSTSKGPESEGVVIQNLCDKTYAFIGLERIGGVMVYDITVPTAPVFVTYVNNRDYTQTPGAATVNTIGDLGPEGLLFIAAAQSPNGKDLLLTANEVSGTVTLYSVTEKTAPVVHAELDAEDHGHRSEGEFEVEIDATDNCSIAAVNAVMTVPTMTNPTIQYSIESRKKLKFEPASNKIKVEAPSPQQFWQDILAAGGVPVIDGQEIEIEIKANSSKHEFSFSNSGRLTKIKAPSARLFVTAIDVAGNIASDDAVPDFSMCKDGAAQVDGFSLGQNVPNPFNPSTSITYTIPASGAVTLTVYSMLGERVATLVDGVLDAGAHHAVWNGANSSGARVPGGVYFYELRATAADGSGTLLAGRKMILLP
ncbi:MAG: choice-of-anchor I family protein [Ignavibacteria bacterium]|nr:choice-of-anchor I family protein [Ignavibacteria bacterium]